MPHALPPKIAQSRRSFNLHAYAQVLSFLSDHVDNESLSATAGVVSGVAAALTAWQEFSGSDRKINR